MQSSLKKSLYLGLAALSFAGVAAVSTTASAKSYATAGAYSTLKTDATKRNVEATGTNALYTKPGTVKGAKVVASKATMAKLASSKKSADYFRAYGVKTTNRGSVYYRVVSMDGKYRGYIYGGKSDTAFAGGIKSADTTTKATMPTNTTVYFKNPGTANVTWTAPKYTQYKAAKNVVNTTPFAGDTLTITDAATKTREGSLYYYVKDAQHPTVSGWIYSGAVTTDKTVAFNQATDVKVNFVDGSSVVTSGVLQSLFANNATNTAASTTPADAVGTAAGFSATAKATQDWADALLKGTGYSINLKSGSVTAANQAALLAAKTGDTITLNVTKNSEVTTPLYLKKAATTSTANDAESLTAYKTGDTASDTTVVVPSLTSGFKGVDGAAFTSATLKAFATSNNLTTLYTPTIVTGADAYYIKYTLSTAEDGTYGAKSAATLVYTASDKIKGESPASTTSNGDNGSVWGSTSTSSSSTSSSAASASSTEASTSSSASSAS